MNEKTMKVLEFDKILHKLEDFAVSKLGKEHIQNLEPSTDFSVVRDRLQETTDGVNFILKLGMPSLGGLKDIREALKRLNVKGMLNCKELLDIADTLRVARVLKSYLNKDRNILEGNILNELISRLFVNKKLEDEIFSAIISEDELDDHASHELFSIRRQIASAQVFIKNKLNELVKSTKYTKYMQEAIITIRDGRYVIPVKQEYRGEVAGLVHDASASGATIFVEPMVVVESNNKIKGLKIKERIEIDRILKYLTNEVDEIYNEVESNLWNLGTIDFIFAKANFSLKYRCECPTLSEKKEIYIHKGRHILLKSSSVVPIDFWLGKDFSTLVITGPNTGGKTVTLKTVGLFALMTQSGLHVPAGCETVMPVFDDIYADIGDEQSIEQNLSTFSSHMKNIINILNSADCNSLVLFDEIGAGTDPTEGAALAMSILNYIRERKISTVATTHYSELKVYAGTTEGVENASCEFDVETLKPTYKLLIGVPGRSNAFAISKKLGLSDKIIQDAHKLLTKEQIQFENMLQQIEYNIQQTESEKNKTASLRMEIERMQNELADQKERLANQKSKILKEARVMAKKILEDAKENASNVINEINKARDLENEKERNKKLEESRLKLKIGIDNLDKELEEKLIRVVEPRDGCSGNVRIKDLKIGDSVYIINLDKNGTVLKINPDKKEILVLVGIMKLNVSIKNIRKLANKSSSVVGISTRKTRDISTSVDVRGNNLEEAIYLVDKYLDDVSMSNLVKVTIVHGKGSGVLREGIQNFLKKHPKVASFRNGSYGEGELGVTVVEMKQ